MLPTPLLLDDGRLRIYLACCDDRTVSRIGWLDVDAAEPARVLRWAREPVLDIGQPGCFDDNGVNPCSVVRLPDGRLRLYYNGYQLQRQVPYTLFAGVAEADGPDGPFRRVQEVPVLDRAPGERLFRTAPFVTRPAGEAEWSMLYIAGDAFGEAAGRVQPRYGMRRLASRDGLSWPSRGEPVLEPAAGELGFSRPWLHALPDGTAAMWHAIRTPDRYRIGHATADGQGGWTRRDDDAGLAGAPGEWDGGMQCYPALHQAGDATFMFYNGDGYGRTGLGLAVLEQA